MPALPNELTSDLTDRITAVVARDNLPGLAVGVVRDQELVWTRQAGWADVERRAAATPDTLFRVASITKTLTAGAVLQLRDAGKLALDEPLETYLPEFAAARMPAADRRGVTLRRLLTHRSGLTTEAPLPCWDALVFPTREELLEVLPRLEVVIPRDSAFKYSNLAFGLLGEVIARVSGRSYNDYMHAALLGPLGLSGGFEPTPELESRRAGGYLAHAYDDGWSPAPYVELHAIGACGQLFASVRDLSKWIALQFRTDPQTAERQPVLAPETLAEMHRPQYLEPDWSVGYCLGWRANRYGQRVFHGHGGGIHGFASQILFSTAAKLGVVALANVWPHPGLLPFSAELLGRLIDHQEREASAPVAPAARQPPVPVPPEYATLLGTYIAAPWIPARIVWRDGALVLDKSALSDYWLHVPARLEPTDSPRTFIARGGRAAGERVTFARSDAHDGWTFSLGGFVYRQQDGA